MQFSLSQLICVAATGAMALGAQAQAPSTPGMPLTRAEADYQTAVKACNGMASTVANRISPDRRALAADQRDPVAGTPVSAIRNADDPGRSIAHAYGDFVDGGRVLRERHPSDRSDDAALTTRFHARLAGGTKRGKCRGHLG